VPSATAADANFWQVRPPPNVLEGLEIAPSEHDPGPDFVIDNAGSDVVGGGGMTEDSHLLAWSSTLLKCFREHRMPRREAVRPFEKEPRMRRLCGRRGR
jgi:hypothetical protein